VSFCLHFCYTHSLTVSAEFAKMSQQQQKAPGGHYSGANPIPTVKEFIEKLDVTKKDRDTKLDRSDGPKEPKDNLKPGKNQKTVTDPVTGSQVVIENANKSMIDEADNPKVYLIRLSF
jgi:hypothetical protein